MGIFMLFHAVLPDGAALIRPTNRRSNKAFALPSDRVLPYSANRRSNDGAK
ncbi:Uncharacterised protein [Salmonella enterica subsp. enterica serovar Braenderup]|nr:Uncharacterised protein [Salmonella enterica subsp. enterica serovar Braenderup]